MFKGGKPAQRYIPGQAIPGAPPPGAPPGSQGSSGKEDKKKRVRSKRPLKEAGVDGGATPDNVNGAATPADVDEQVGKLQIGENTSAVDEAVVKKIRNLTKKVSRAGLCLPTNERE
jgi:translation initiation factor 2A